MRKLLPTRPFVTLFYTTALVSFVSPGFANGLFSVTGMGRLTGDSSNAYGVNNRGEVVGYYTRIGGAGEHAILFNAGLWGDLGTLGAPYSYAWGINDNGQIVGGAGSNEGFHPFLRNNGVMFDLGTFGGYLGEAYAINNVGEVVGWAETDDFVPHAFLYTGGHKIDIGQLMGWSMAKGINDLSQVVGYMQVPSGALRAFLYSDSTVKDLGTLGGSESEAFGINNQGHVVGYAFLDSNAALHAFKFQDGKMTDLGTVYGGASRALAINNREEIIGVSDGIGFLCVSGKLADLNKLIDANSGWTINSATALNDKGQIVGFGNNPTGYTEAFLLTPLRFAVNLVTSKVECGNTDVTAWVSDATGHALAVEWNVNGIPVQTNNLPTNNPPLLATASLMASLPLGTNNVTVVLTDGISNAASCSASVVVVDTTSPMFQNVRATPEVLWPPNDKLIDVEISADTVDACGSATWKIVGVASNEPEGTTNESESADWLITGDHSLKLRSNRPDIGSERIYTILIQAADASGNISPIRAVTVSAPLTKSKPMVSRHLSIPFYANLSGDNEVPAKRSSYSGSASFLLEGNVLSYSISISPDYWPTAGGIFGPANPTLNSKHRVAYLNTTNLATDGTYSGRIVLGDKDVIRLLCGRLYVNIASANFPGEEVRGAILVQSPLQFAASLAITNRHASVLNPGNENIAQFEVGRGATWLYIPEYFWWSNAIVEIMGPSKQGTEPVPNTPILHDFRDPTYPDFGESGWWSMTDEAVYNILRRQTSVSVNTPGSATVRARMLPVDANGNYVPDYVEAYLQEICPCEADWKNHKQYVTSVRDIVINLSASRIITWPEARTIVKRAVQSGCGKDR